LRLEIAEAVDLILALPAHRSRHEAHRKLGNCAFDLLLEYKEQGDDDKEKTYNRKMICAILATVRTFSIERDIISQEWQAIEAIKQRRERLLAVIRNISPFEKGNYWSKILSIIAASGVALSKTATEGKGIISALENTIASSIGWLILILFALEVGSKLLEFMLASLFEKKLPIDRNKAWENQTVESYKKIVSHFIDYAILLYRKYYPDKTKLYGFQIDNDNNVQNLKKYLIDGHFYY